MSAKAVTLFLGRIKPEEGDKRKPYDDATGKPVAAPVGNLSWGWGFNLMVCGSEELFRVMAQHLVTELDQQLSDYAWYAGLDSESTRQSVFLDVAYNNGVGGLLHFPHMIALAVAKKWHECAAECIVVKTNPSLDASRYAPLRALINAGDTAT